MVVIPNVGSLAMWSPPLDHYGNSVRGLKFTSNLLSLFETKDNQSFFHPFNNRNSVMSSLYRNTVATGHVNMAENIMFPSTRRYLHSNSLQCRQHVVCPAVCPVVCQTAGVRGRCLVTAPDKPVARSVGCNKMAMNLCADSTRKLLQVARRIVRF